MDEIRRSPAAAGIAALNKAATVGGRRVPTAVLVVGLASLIAGASSEAPALLGTVAAQTRDQLLPPGCQPAVAHHAGGIPAGNTALTPAACSDYVRDPASGSDYRIIGEPTIGIGKDGSVYYYPLLLSPQVPWAPQGAEALGRRDPQTGTWSPVIPALAGKPWPPRSWDPFMYVDPTTSRLVVSDLNSDLHCKAISLSDDDGGSWQHAIGGCSSSDHQKVFAGPPVFSKTTSYPNILYVCAFGVVETAAAHLDIGCEKSLDGGVAWLPTGAPVIAPRNATDPGDFGFPAYCQAVNGPGVVGHDGTIYMPVGSCNEAGLAVSHDEGLTWRWRTVNRDLGLPVSDYGARGSEPGVGVDDEGTLYYAWIAHNRLPYLTISHDGGTSWEPPKMVAAPGVNEANYTQLAIGGPGRLTLTYMGTTKSPNGGPPFPNEVDDCKPSVVAPTQPLTCISNAQGNAQGGSNPSLYDKQATPWNGYMMETDTALNKNPTYYTATVNDPSHPLVRGTCGPWRCQEAYDFLDVRIGPDGSPWASFVDQCDPECTSTRLGAALAGHMISGPRLLSDR